MGVGAPGPGSVIGARYRLAEHLRATAGVLSATDGGQLWRADDLVLSRPVALRLLWDADPETRARFLDAAVTQGRTASPLLTATYDAAEELRDPDGKLAAVPHRAMVTYVVREWVDGTSLRDLIAEAPLSAPDATALLRDAARAVASLHQAGYVHGRVHPGNLLVRRDGQLRVCDAGIGVALLPGSTNGGWERSAQDLDLTGLGQSLYAALTGHWPGPTWRGLSGAPRGVGAGDPVLAPRQVRAGVPRAVDAVTCSVLGLETDLGPLSSAADMAAALDSIPAAYPEHPEAPPAAQPPPSWPRRTGYGLAAALVAVLVVALAMSVRHHTNQTAVPAFTALPAPAGRAGLAPPVPIAAVSSFDPPPGDGSEYPGEVGLAHDGKPNTAWQTQQYATRTFGSIKSGVGLLVDLGKVQRVDRVDLSFLVAGSDIEVRAMPPGATGPGARATDFPLVAAQSNVGTAVALRSNTAARYWLVWLTGLPDDRGAFRGTIAEMAFQP